MGVREFTDKERVEVLLAQDPVVTLEALDENRRGVQGLVSVFADPEEERPANVLALRWGQRHLGLGSAGLLSAGRLSGLDELAAAVPERGHYELLLPFWASPAIAGRFVSSPLGAEAVYTVTRGGLRPAPSSRQAVRLDDPEVIRPMFPKLAPDLPAYVLSLRGELTAVAAVTHAFGDRARVRVYTVEPARGRGFGRGVLGALAEELMALGLEVSALVDLSQEGAVRMVEGAGFRQHTAFLKLTVSGRRPAVGPGLVGLPR